MNQYKFTNNTNSNIEISIRANDIVEANKTLELTVQNVDSFTLNETLIQSI